MNKTLLCSTIAASLIFLAMPTPAQTLQLTPELQTVKLNEVFSVDIEWVDGAFWIGGTFAVAYDDTLLEFIDYAYGDLGDPDFNSTPVLSDGLIDRLGFGSFSGVSEGVAITLYFALRLPGQAFIDVRANGDWSNGIDFILYEPDATDGAVGNDGVSRGTFPDGLLVEDVPLGETVQFQVDLSSVGTAPLTVFDVTLPTDQDVFSVAADNCSGQVLQLGESCTATINAVAFEFARNASHITNVDFLTSDVIDQDPDTRLVLSNRRPRLDVPRLEFYDGRVAPPYVRKTVPITNVGQWPADMSSVDVHGNQGTNFVMLENRCKGTLLAVDSACEVVIEFRPTTHRAYNARYGLFYGNEQLNDFANIVGYTPTGLPWVDDREVTDWFQVLGDDQVKIITLNNKGSVPLNLENSSIQSTNGFEVSENCTGVTLPGGGFCEVTLRSVHQTPGDYEWSGWIHSDTLTSTSATRMNANITVTASKQPQLKRHD